MTARGFRRIELGFEIHCNRELLLKSVDRLDPHGIGEGKVHVSIRIRQHEAVAATRKPELGAFGSTILF